MATVALTLLSERWLNELVFTGVRTNVGADAADGYTLPAGIGDVALMEALLIVDQIATLVATPELLGCEWTIRNAASSITDIVGVSRFQKTTNLKLATYVSPDPLVQWKQDELLFLVYPELDTNVAPTDDHRIVVKCTRIPLPEPAPGPVQLVR